MKTLVLFCALILSGMTARIQAKELQALFCNAGFLSQTEGPYVETYLKVYGPSAEFVKTPAGKFQASLKVTIVFKNGDKITDFRKYNLLSAELEDTLKGLPDLIDQQRIKLPHGVYELNLSIADNNSKGKPVELKCATAVEFDKTNLKFSDFEFVESYKATGTANILSKSGFESSKDKVIMDDYAKFQRQKSAAINILLVSIPISDLPNGNYNLVVDCIDRNNEVLARQKIGFQRSNPGLQLDASDIKAIDITSTFAEKITSLDSLVFYLQCLNPIATMKQNQFVDKVVKTNEIAQMQKFLYGFWKTRNNQYPEAEWNSYKYQVLAIEDAYKTKVKHGFETDMGYTWLKYGTPNEVIDSKHEPSAVPYIIWKYFHIENQSDVRFVFSNPNLVGTEYSLFYSNARDDRFNTAMGRNLYERTTGFGSEGAWGSKFSSNFKR